MDWTGHRRTVYDDFKAGARAWLRRVVPPMRSLPVLRGPLRGTRWVARAWGSLLGNYEPDVRRAFRRLIQRGDIVYDIGAHIGVHTVYAARLVGSQGRVIAFEPAPRNAAFLKHHLRINHVTNVVLLESAASDRSGSDEFIIPRDDAISGEGHLADTPGYAGVSGDRATIPTVALDNVVSPWGDLPIPSVVKVDVEGAESRILRGMARTLDVHQPDVIVSIHGANWHCADVLCGHGYRIAAIGPDTIIGVARPQRHIEASVRKTWPA